MGAGKGLRCRGRGGAPPRPPAEGDREARAGAGRGFAPRRPASLLLKKLSGVRMMTTFYLAENDHRWGSFISLKTIKPAEPLRSRPALSVRYLEDSKENVDIKLRASYYNGVLRYQAIESRF